jgi:hypothetical protein
MMTLGSRVVIVREAFLQWAEAYWQRMTPTSFGGHQARFEGFAKTKTRLGQQN